MIERRTDPGAHMAAYSYLQLLFAHGVRVDPGVWPATQPVACTYCGGPHARSACRWPLVEKCYDI